MRGLLRPGMGKNFPLCGTASEAVYFSTEKNVKNARQSLAFLTCLCYNPYLAHPCAAQAAAPYVHEEVKGNE